MALANLGNLCVDVAVARSDLAQILPRHAIEAVNTFPMIASGYQQFIKRRPIVAPIQIETDALPQFSFVDFAPPPFLEDMLVRGEYRFHTKDDRTIAHECALLHQ